MAIPKPPTYGPPSYDVSKKGNMASRKRAQAKRGKPSPMYSSNWHDFQGGTLNVDPVIKRRLHKLAIRAAFALKRHIPIGDDEDRDGHLRNAVRIETVLRGGMYADRTVYHVHAGGSGSKRELGKWHGTLYRATFSSAEAFKARRYKGGEVGEIPSWLKKAEGDVTRG